MAYGLELSRQHLIPTFPFKVSFRYHASSVVAATYLSNFDQHLLKSKLFQVARL